ncbi:MAG: Phosphoglycerate kinase [Candidatus Amesbacteria bacterium GW2011_GWA2_42_12]|uniref:phosphoglycerate kinase n=1 Tax=Candidatus Amesbacteria bacterium GW2011_GWA2_42_12 TaxID=1618356 RepID=A0A0G0Y7J3_9BACT|nr:MAG: Phosphoglycerate kinase [Candidatus Amesbacteria bacterium GW2011_GWA2_42_12]
MISILEIDVADKSVLVRADLDLPAGRQDSNRERATVEIIKYLREKKAERIKIIGHKGNIGMVEKFGVDVNFDLRADKREEENSMELAQELAQGFDVYVNEAFATSHRRHTSIVALPEFMKSQGKIVCGGLRFGKEIKILSSITPSPPLNLRGGKLLIVGGAKTLDKEKYAQDFEKNGWTVLRGGLLPNIKLRADGLDISTETVANYKSQIANAKIIVVAGPMGKYETQIPNPKSQIPKGGTYEVFKAIAESNAYKIAGGGDTESALEEFGLSDKFDWISVGGGAMLEFLMTGTLPGIEALTSQ